MDPTTQGKANDPVPGVFRRTGGLQWHARVLRRWRLHQPFRNEIAEFLGAWRPAGSRLILVGSSAGWFLPSRFLAQFSRLTMIELDRSAPFFQAASRLGAAPRRIVRRMDFRRLRQRVTTLAARAPRYAGAVLQRPRTIGIGASRLRRVAGGSAFDARGSPMGQLP